VRLANIENKPTQFLSATSFTVDEFELLHMMFSESFAEYMKYNTLEGKVRQRSFTIRKNSIFQNTKDMLLFIVMYMKNYPLQEYQAMLFKIYQPKANMYIHLFTKIIQKSLKDNKYAPLRIGKNLNEKLTELGIKDCYCDGTEREITRSTDYELQKEYYSGKSKKHTVKNNVMSDNTGRVLHLSDTCKGRVHDKRILDESNVTFNDDTILFLDTGYKGFTDKKATIIMPAKKKKGQELTVEEKAENKNISSDRVKNEHTMSGVKRLRIVKDKLKVWANNFHDTIMEICCGLHNLRIEFRKWNYPELKTNPQNYKS